VEDLQPEDASEQEISQNGMLQDAAPDIRSLAETAAAGSPAVKLDCEGCSSVSQHGHNAGYSLVWPALLIIAIMAAIAVCEYVFAYKNVAYGIIIALGLVIVLYTVLTVCPLRDELASCIESIALVPLYILFTSSLPWFFVHQDLLLPAVYSCVLALCWLHIYQKQLDLKQIFGALPGKRQLAWMVPAGTAIGVGLGYIEYIILRPTATFGHITVLEIAVNLIYMLFFVGLGEEMLFRGFIQSDLCRCFGWKWGLVLASVLFCIMHLTWRSVPELFFVFLAGLLFGSLYLKTRGLYLSILVHCMDDVVLDAVFPFIIGPAFSYKVQLLVWHWMTCLIRR
jgi:membrane protease YdiL (CAAX protease family)